MSTDQNKALISKMFDEVMNKRNFSELEGISAPEFVNHGMPSGKPGPEGFKEIIMMFIDAFPDMQISIEQLVGDGDMVATRGSWKGTHRGDFMGLPATGKEATVTYQDMWKIQNGKCLENWVDMDIAGLMRQLGAMPS